MKPRTAPVLNVLLGRWHDQCTVMGKRVRCDRTPRFMVCGDDGKPMLSRLEASVCDRHLPLAIIRIRKAQG